MKVLRELIQIGSAIHASIHCLCQCGHTGVYDASPMNGRTFPPLTLPGRKANGHLTCCKLLAKLSNWLSLLLVMITGCIFALKWYLLQLYCWICICCFIYHSSSNNLCCHWADHCVGRVCSVLEKWHRCNIDRCCWKWHHKLVSIDAYTISYLILLDVCVLNVCLQVFSNEIRLASLFFETLPYLFNTAAKAPNDAHHDAGPPA